MFNYPAKTWADTAVIGWLIDAAAIVNQLANAKGSYGPYCRALERICFEESLEPFSKKEKVFQVYLTNPANTTSKEYLDEPEENEIKEMLKSVGMTGVGMEIQERGNNWGFVIVYGAYERADQVFKAIDKIGLKFGHFIYFDNGKTLSPAPGTKPPETGTQGEIVKAVTK